jgi:diguanylate cyclase (GGDEF)-like protein/PAS domain S-box-containing protein
VSSALPTDAEQASASRHPGVEQLIAERDALLESLRQARQDALVAESRWAREHEEVRVAHSLLAATLDATADGILVADGAGGIVSFNERFAEMWGIPRAVLATGDDEHALAWVLQQLDDPDTFLLQVRDLYATPSATSRDTLSFRDGRVFERLSRPQRLDGAIVGRVWSFRDVTDRHNLERELARRAFHDPLTGLANRALLLERLEEAVLSRPAGSLVAVAVIDLDRFKDVNDTLGHGAGDDVLTGVAALLDGIVGRTGTVARLGGDEFAILLPATPSPLPIANIARGLIEALTTPMRIGDRDVTVLASIGVATTGDGEVTASQLLRDADTALYCAKGAGKACYRVYDPASRTAWLESLAIRRALRDAVDGDRITVAYQPIIDAATGGLVAVEALARWNDPTRGAIPPDVFIAIAEESGLIGPLGERVLHLALTQLAAWRVSLPELRFRVAVNVSRRQLADRALSGTVEEALRARGLVGADLTLEITESAVALEPSTIVDEALQVLRATGVRIAIDDFGTGQSSLATLASRPVDALKIDRRFVSSLARDARSGAVVQAIIHVAAALKLATTAEGVETIEQRDMLRSLGCGHLQGYLIGRPMSAEDAFAYLARHAARAA